jgi:hypothetical protein
MPPGQWGLLIWALAMFAFLLPYSAAIADLSAKHPREGGGIARKNTDRRDDDLDFPHL